MMIFLVSSSTSGILSSDIVVGRLLELCLPVCGCFLFAPEQNLVKHETVVEGGCLKIWVVFD